MDSSFPLHQTSELMRLHRALKTLSATNRVLVRATEEGQLLQQICQIIVTIGGYPLVWVGFAQQDEFQSVRVVAGAGEDAGYLSGLQISWADNKWGQGPTGTAIRTGTVKITHEIATDASYEPWRLAATQRGYASSIALPLLTSNDVLGALNLYATESDAFDESELELLKELADDITYGIVLLRTQQTNRQNEQVLRQREEQLRMVLETAQLGLWDWNMMTGVVNWSSRHEQLFGLSPDSFDGQYETFQNCIHPADRDRIFQAIEYAMQNQTTYHEEFRVVWKDGSVRWIEGRGKFCYTLDGKPVRMSGTVLDITNRKQYETALKQSKDDLEIKVAERTAELTQLTDRLQDELLERKRAQHIAQEQAQLLDLAHDTILVLDLNYQITFWNYGAEITYGWSKAEALGQQSFSLLKTQFPQPLAEIQTELLQMGHWEGELIHTKRDKTLVIVASRWVLQQNHKGEPIAILEINRNITQRKQVEAALRESEERFRNAFDNAPIGMAIVDLEGRWLQVNTALCNIVGYSEAELLCTTFQAITHPEDLIQEQAYIQQLLAQETQTYELEKRYFHQQGHTIWVLLNVSLIQDIHGKPLYFICQIQDITVRREVERMKSEFISIVSHELRTPLTSIRGSLGLLASGALKNYPDRAHRMIEIAAIDIERLVRLVNDILDLERLESGKIALVMDRCDAEVLLQRSVEAMRSFALKEDITLTVLPTSAQVWASADHVIQTLTNLISNAIKFSNPNSTVWLSATPIPKTQPGITLLTRNDIETDAENDTSDRGWICFCVADQGRGIPSDKLEAIFGRFQQVDASDSRRKGGTGLGLAICQSIVQQHGGQIWVESYPGKGSRFYFTLPSLQPDQDISDFERLHPQAF